MLHILQISEYYVHNRERIRYRDGNYRPYLWRRPLKRHSTQRPELLQRSSSSSSSSLASLIPTVDTRQTASTTRWNDVRSSPNSSNDRLSFVFAVLASLLLLRLDLSSVPIASCSGERRYEAAAQSTVGGRGGGGGRRWHQYWCCHHSFVKYHRRSFWWKHRL